MAAEAPKVVRSLVGDLLIRILIIIIIPAIQAQTIKIWRILLSGLSLKASFLIR